MATSVAGTVSLEPSDWSLPLTVLGAHGLHAGSSRGGGPPPKLRENRGGCSTGLSGRNGKKPGMVLRARGLHPAQRSWGGSPGASPLGQKPHSCEHPASAAHFLVWVLGKGRSCSAAPAVCSPPAPTPQWPSPWCSPSCGCLLFMGPPLPSAPPAAPPLWVVPGSWQVYCPLGGPPFASAAPSGRSNCSEGSRLPLTCFCLGSSPPGIRFVLPRTIPAVPQTPNGSFLSASPCPTSHQSCCSFTPICPKSQDCLCP